MNVSHQKMAQLMEEHTFRQKQVSSLEASFGFKHPNPGLPEPLLLQANLKSWIQGQPPIYVEEPEAPQEQKRLNY